MTKRTEPIAAGIADDLLLPLMMEYFAENPPSAILDDDDTAKMHEWMIGRAKEIGTCSAFRNSRCRRKNV